MKENHWRFLTLFLLLSLVLASCTEKSSVQTSIMLTASVSVAATETVPPTPTATSIAEPASLTGEIRLLDGVEEAFVRKIEIRENETFRLIGAGDTDFNVIYNIEDIEPGVYEVWILITEEAAMLPGCDDMPRRTIPGAWGLNLMMAKHYSWSMPT